jgi:MoxR-like ATPase
MGQTVEKRNFRERMREMTDTVLSDEFEKIVKRVSRHLKGKEEAIVMTMTAYFAGGHILLEDIPGVGKTTLAKSFSAVMGLDFGRIQFTSDLLPADITGMMYYDRKSGGFILKKGPIFTGFLLADEINRSMPKTQSALLEAMEEGQVTIDGVEYALPEPFFVIATQNPYEEVGTFPLPYSQLDRFICSFGIGYPDREAERTILSGYETIYDMDSEKPIMDTERSREIMDEVKRVHLSDAMLDYIQNIVAFSRESGLFRYGLSTRGALALTAMTRARARLHGRDYAIPDDLQSVSAEVCIHRLSFREGKSEIGRLRDEFLSQIHPDP